MYKEMYLALMTDSALADNTLVDNISTTNRAYCLISLTNIQTAYFNKMTTLAANGFRGNSVVKNVYLPLVTTSGANQFYADNALNVLSIPNCTDLGSNSLGGTPLLRHVYMTNVAKSSTSGFPWGSNNRYVVFHLSDGDYDDQGNPVTT